jgi:hypothetical protein
MTVSAPIRHRLERSGAPRGCSAPGLTVLLQRGLHWLYDIAQPPGAIIDARSAVAAAGNRFIRFVPLGWGWHGGVVVDVAHVRWGAGTRQRGPESHVLKRASRSGSTAGRTRRRYRGNALPAAGFDRHD